MRAWRHPRIVTNLPYERKRLHRHGDARLILFLSGELAESSFGHLGHFVPGDLLYRPAFFGHADAATRQGSSYIHLPVSPAAVRACTNRHGWAPLRGRVAIDNLDLASLLRSPAWGDRMLETLGDVAYTPSRGEGPLKLVSDRLANEADVRIADLSACLEVPPYDFARKFTREFGIPPRVYRREARLQRAMALLAEGGRTLIEVALSSGHYDQSHLTRNLKCETGLTPLEFRAAARAR